MGDPDLLVRKITPQGLGSGVTLDLQRAYAETSSTDVPPLDALHIGGPDRRPEHNEEVRDRTEPYDDSWEVYPEYGDA